MSKKMSASVKAKLAAYHAMHRGHKKHKRHAKHNPFGFGGVSLGRDAHGRFVKNPHSAHDYGHMVGKYAKKTKRGAHAAYHGTKSFFSGMHKGWHENPYHHENSMMSMRHNSLPIPAPLMNPKRKMSTAAKVRHYKSLMAQMQINGLATGLERARYAKMAQFVAAHGGAHKNPYGSGPFPMPFMNPKHKHKKHHKSSPKAHRGHMLARSLRRDAHGRFLPRGY